MYSLHLITGGFGRMKPVTLWQNKANEKMLFLKFSWNNKLGIVPIAPLLTLPKSAADEH